MVNESAISIIAYLE